MPGASISQIPFQFGLAEGADPHHVPPGTLVTAENVVWKKSGRLDKRPGTSLMTAGSFTSGVRLVPRPDGLAAIDNDDLNAFATGVGWLDTGELSQYTATWTTSVDTVDGVRSWDVCLYGGLEVTAWANGNADTGLNSVFVRVRNATTGEIVVAPKYVCAGESVRLLSDSTNSVVHILVRHYNGATHNIDDTRLTPSTGSLTSTTTLVTDLYSTPTVGNWDAVLVASSPETIVLFYAASGGAGGAPKLASFNAGTLVSVTSATIVEPNRVEFGAAIDGSATDALYVVYGTASTAIVRVAVVNPTTLATTVAPATVEDVSGGALRGVGVRWMSAGNAIITYTATPPAAPAGFNYRCSSVKFTSGAVSTTTRRGTYGFSWVSRPFLYQSRYFAVAQSYMTNVDGVIEPPATVLLEVETSANAGQDWQPHRHVSTIDILIGGYQAPYCVPANGYTTGSVARVFSPFQSTVASPNGFPRQGLRAVELATRGGDYARPVRAGAADILACGVAEIWDGQRVDPLGFIHSPCILDTSTSAGGSMVDGDYLYTAVYEYRDRAGVLHRSAPATPVTVTVPPGDSAVTLEIANYSLDPRSSDFVDMRAGRLAPIQIAIYRSTVGSSILHRLTLDTSANYATNDSTLGVNEFTDSRADASIDGGSVALDTRPLIYTAGDILPERQPPTMRTLLSHKGRLWGISGDGQSVFFTKLYADDPTIAPGWNEDFLFPFDQTLTALGGLDEKVVFFSDTDIWYTVGDGPAANGSGSDYPQPIHTPSPVGCSNPRSLVETPNGLMFQSSRGIYLLNRGLELDFIGRNVQDETAAYPNITSAVLVQKKNQVRFTANNAGNTAGIVLVYDLLMQQWSTFKYTNTATSTASTPIADSVVRSDGTWCFLTPTGRVFVEDDTTYLDGGTTWVTITLETAWISGTGPIQWQTVRNFQLQGVSNTNHALTISAGFDSETAYVQSEYFPAKSKVTSIGPLEECKMIIGNRRKCRHIRFKIQDSSPGGSLVGNGQGPSLSTMGVTVGVRPLFTNMSPAKQG